MPSQRQTRRTVSFKAEVFERMRRFCEKEGIPLARWVERMVTLGLDRAEQPKVTRGDALRALHAAPTERAAKLEEARRRAFG